MTEQWLPDPEAQLAFGSAARGALAAASDRLSRGRPGDRQDDPARGVLAGLGHRGRRAQPDLHPARALRAGERRLYHLDLYRLGDPQELEYLGLRDLLAEDAVWMVEWPERGLGMLPPPDLQVDCIAMPRDGRRLRLSAGRPSGESVLEASWPGGDAGRATRASRIA
jgi:tRNA threonylcarbamoyladenosine biosynthesis protein TsaE